MTIKSYIGAACTCLAVATFNVNAALVSSDWQTTGDNFITIDDSGIEWLDFSVTAGRSFSDISSNLGAGQEFDGFRFATSAEMARLFSSAGGDGTYYNHSHMQSLESVQYLASFIGNLCTYNCDNEKILSQFMVVDDGNITPTYGMAAATYTFAFGSYMWIPGMWLDTDVYVETSPDMASALVRVSAVPVPAAVWLFGSGLLGLIGIARRKTRS